MATRASFGFCADSGWLTSAMLQSVDRVMVAIQSQADRCVTDRPDPRPQGVLADVGAVDGKAMGFLSKLRATVHGEGSIAQVRERSLKALLPYVKTV